MKKLISLMLALIMAFAFCACENNKAKDDGLTVFFSHTGFSLEYPEIYTPTTLSESLDFVLMDEASGSSVTVYVENADKSAESFSEADFIAKKSAQGMEISSLTFEKTEMNGAPAVCAEYRHNESKIREVVYFGESATYYATYTELAGTAEKVSLEFGAIINSLVV